MDAFEEEPPKKPKGRIVVHTGRYPPRLSRTTKRYLAEHNIIVVFLPHNGRDALPNLVQGENTP